MIKNICEGQEIVKAATDAGYNEKYAAKNIDVIMNKEPVKAKFEEILEKNGLDDEFLAARLKDGVMATKVISAVQTKSKTDPEMQEASGATTDFVEVPDYTNRHRFLKTALELKSKFPDRKVKVEQTNVTLEALLLELRQKKEQEEIDITPDPDSVEK